MSRRGVSLAEKRKTVAERWLAWWMTRQPLTGIAGLAAGLTGAIAPGTITVSLNLHTLAAIVAPTTIPVFGLIAISSFVSLVAWMTDPDF